MPDSIFSFIVGRLGLLIYYVWYSRRKKQQETERKSALTREYPYEGLRNLALNTVPGAILATIPQGETMVYCVVMDWDMGNDVVTLVAQLTGDASLYVKSGGGIIGAGKYAAVSGAAQRLTSAARQHLGDATLTTAVSLPAKNCVKFYLLTNNGRYTASEDYQNIESGASKWAGLFGEASNLMAEMRKSPTTQS